MRHFIATAAAALLSTAAFAQQANVWYTDEVKADALIGNAAYRTFSLVTEKYDGIIYRSDYDNVIVGCHEGIFDYHDNKVDVLVGYYRNGELVDKATGAWQKGGSGDMMISDEAVGLKIKRWLESGGDVRIIAPRFGKEYLDMNVPHRK